LAISPDEKTIAVANGHSDSITLIKTSTLEKTDLYYRPVWAFEYHWAPRDRRGVVEIDALTGLTRQGQSLLPSGLKKMMSRDMLFDIDYQGTQQVKQKAAGDAVTIFILPPSMKELRSRLERRAEDRPDVIDKRLNEARNEIRRWTDYDYVLVNDDLQSTFAGIRAILAVEHSRTARAREGIAAFVERLLGET